VEDCQGKKYSAGILPWQTAKDHCDGVCPSGYLWNGKIAPIDKTQIYCFCLKRHYDATLYTTVK
jgi:hypothetical protein